MRHRVKLSAAGAVLAAAVLFGAVGAAAYAADPAVTADGIVASVGDSTFVLTTSQGGDQKIITLGAQTLVMARQEAKTEDIRVGDAMGVDAKRRPDGSLRAVAINIFSPELWKVVRKGQWPMESGDVMTNAVVTQAAVASMDTRSITLKYEDVTAVITLPDDTKVRRIVNLSREDLKPGMKVTVRGTASADGSIAASSVFEDRS